MKYLFYLFACCILISCQQANKTSDKQDTQQIKTATAPNDLIATDSNITNPSSIAGIKKAFTATNAKLLEKRLDSIAYQYDCNQERAGTITYFTEKGKLLLIKHSYNEYDHYSANDYYFISNDSLYFANLNSTYWSFESGSAAQAATKDEVTEKRIYIVNEQAELCLEKKYTIHSNNKDPKIAAAMQNKQISCKTINPLLSDFNNLLLFRNSSNKKCLEKTS